MKSLLKRLSPFAPDQSGAVSALFEFGGLIVICDAGGCTGNICGFDEPRWFTRRSAVFSAGLRDMDAILGRDDNLVEKLRSAVSGTDVNFAALIGTPVPAIIATDFKALKRMTEKRTGRPAVTVAATGTNHYDKGAGAAWLELFKMFASEHVPVNDRAVGVLGLTPLDFSCLDAGEYVKSVLHSEGWGDVFCYGMGAGLDAVRRASSAAKNLVISPAGLPAALYLQKTFGTPYELRCPWIPPQVSAALPRLEEKKVLVIHQQFAANAVRQEILSRGIKAQINTASWFTMLPECSADHDFRIDGEEAFADSVRDGGYDAIVGDAGLKKALPGWSGLWIDFPHFAVSGRLIEENPAQ